MHTGMSFQKWEHKSVIWSKNTLSPEKPANSSTLSNRAGNSERVCVTVKTSNTVDNLEFNHKDIDAIFQLHIPNWKPQSQKRLAL